MENTVSLSPELEYARVQRVYAALFGQRKGGGFATLREARQSFERAYIESMLERNGWDVRKTASILGVQRTNLHRKVRQLGIGLPSRPRGRRLKLSG